MLIGEVVGRLWASRQADGLGGQKMLLVRPLQGGGADQLGRRLLVVADGLGAGPGERVLIAHGSRVRDLTLGEALPDKDVVLGIVDGLQIEPPQAGGKVR